MAKLAPNDYKTASANRYTQQSGDPSEGWIIPADHIASDADAADSFENRTEGADANSGAMKFDRAKGYIYGTAAAPIDGAITYDSTGALLGARCLIFHSDTGIEFPAETVFPQGITANGQYLAEEVNVWELAVISLAPFRVLAAPSGYRESNQLAALQNSNTIEVKANGSNRFFTNVRRWFGNSGTSYTFPTTDTDSGRPIVIFCNDGAVTVDINLANVRDGQYHLFVTKGCTPTNYCRVRIIGQQNVTNQPLLAPSETQVVPDLEDQICYFDITSNKAYLVCFTRSAGVGNLFWVQEFGTGSGGGGAVASVVAGVETSVTGTGAEPVINNQPKYASPVTLSGSVALNIASNRRFYGQPTANYTITDFAGAPAAGYDVMIIQQNAANGVIPIFDFSDNWFTPIGKTFPNVDAGEVVVILFSKRPGMPIIISWEAYEENATNQKPTITGAAKSGSEFVGGVLTWSFTVTDADDDAPDYTSGGTNYDLRAYLTVNDMNADTTGTGGTQLVAGPTLGPTINYTIQAGDANKAIKPFVTPRTLTPTGSDKRIGVKTALPGTGLITAPPAVPEVVLITELTQEASGSATITSYSRLFDVPNVGANDKLLIHLTWEGGTNTANISSLELEGVIPVLVSSNVQTGGARLGNAVYEIAAANVPGGFNRSFVVNFSPACQRVAGAVYRVNGTSQAAPAAGAKATNVFGSGTVNDAGIIRNNLTQLTATGQALMLVFAAHNAPGPVINGESGQVLVENNSADAGYTFWKKVISSALATAGPLENNFTTTTNQQSSYHQVLLYAA